MGFKALIGLLGTTAALALCGVPWAQGGSQEMETRPVPVAIGTIIRAPLQTPGGDVKIVDIQVAGESPDDLFNYWVGYYNQNYYGYDKYHETWRPGPVTYTRASLFFQDDVVEGTIRSFANFTDYDYFFGDNGVLYKRYVNFHQGIPVYTYFVNTATGQRSDNNKLLGVVNNNPELSDSLVAEQARQQEEFLLQFQELGLTYSQWQLNAMTLPSELPSVISYLPEQVPSFSDEHANELTLLDLIEEEIGPLDEESIE